MLTLAITGTTGFVGQAVIDHALTQGQRVLALARRPQAAREGVAWIAGDLANGAALVALCEGANAVIHIAGAVNVPTRTAFAAANIAGTQAIVDAATAAGVSRFVHVSSLAARKPALSNYGWSKAGAEDVVRASSLDWTIVRPPGVYGPRDHDVLEMFRMATRGIMLLPPRGRGSWIHVADLARLLLALASGGASHAILEPDDGAPVTHQQMAQSIAQALGKANVKALHAPRPLLNLAARADRLVRGTKAKLTPDRASYMAHPDWTSNPALRPDPALWRPEIEAKEGLAATASWYREHGWL